MIVGIPGSHPIRTELKVMAAVMVLQHSRVVKKVDRLARRTATVRSPEILKRRPISSAENESEDHLW